MNWIKLAQLSVELLIDLVRGQLEKKPQPAPGLSYKDVEHQRAQMKAATEKHGPSQPR
jgi:hypothetical protein